MNVQIIEKDGRPEWAILPYQDYVKLVEALEDKIDAAAAAAAIRHIKAGEEEVIPAEITERLLAENPYKVWREYRGLTLQEVAKAASVSRAYVSMIENGDRSPSVDVRHAIATRLNVSVEDLE